MVLTTVILEKVLVLRLSAQVFKLAFGEPAGVCACVSIADQGRCCAKAAESVKSANKVEELSPGKPWSPIQVAHASTEVHADAVTAAPRTSKSKGNKAHLNTATDRADEPSAKDGVLADSATALSDKSISPPTKTVAYKAPTLLSVLSSAVGGSAVGGMANAETVPETKRKRVIRHNSTESATSAVMPLPPLRDIKSSGTARKSRARS